MEYTIHQLAELAGVSTRTLRYYDQIGLLPCDREIQSGYRIYGQNDVDRLQQILIFKELGFDLNTVNRLINDPSFDYLAAMDEHLAALKQKECKIRSLIYTVEQTIRREKGEIDMTDSEKFVGLKKAMVEENDKKYGEEIRRKYGEETVAESNRKMMNISEEDYEKLTFLGEQIKQKLTVAVRNGADYKGETGKEIALLHKEWLSITWPQYSPEAHRGLSEMYVADERFMAYYDSEIAGCAQFVHDAIYYHIM